MVRNKNNGNLQISFRLINEKQTNPRFLSAGQNLVFDYNRRISIHGKKKLKKHNLYGDCMDGPGGEDRRRETDETSSPFHSIVDEERNRPRESEEDRATQRERRQAIGEEPPAKSNRRRESGDARWGGDFDNIEEERRETVKVLELFHATEKGEKNQKICHGDDLDLPWQEDQETSTILKKQRTDRRKTQNNFPFV